MDVIKEDSIKETTKQQKSNYSENISDEALIIQYEHTETYQCIAYRDKLPNSERTTLTDIGAYLIRRQHNLKQARGAKALESHAGLHTKLINSAINEVESLLLRLDIPFDIYLDDLRPCPKGMVCCRTAEEILPFLKTGRTRYISFDHDLGEIEAVIDPKTNRNKLRKSGDDVAHLIEELAATDSNFKVPQYSIHSGNPVGVTNIDAAMKSAKRFEAQRKTDEEIEIG